MTNKTNNKNNTTSSEDAGYGRRVMDDLEKEDHPVLQKVNTTSTTVQTLAMMAPVVLLFFSGLAAWDKTDDDLLIQEQELKHQQAMIVNVERTIAARISQFEVLKTEVFRLTNAVNTNTTELAAREHIFNKHVSEMGEIMKEITDDLNSTTETLSLIWRDLRSYNNEHSHDPKTNKKSR